MLNIESMEPLAASIAAHVIKNLTTPVGNTMTFGELFNLYFERHVKIMCKNQDNAYYFFKVHGPRWRDVQVHQIARKDVRAWHDELGSVSQTAANKALNALSAILNWGMNTDVIPVMANPCKGVRRFAENSRTRFLAPKELVKLNEALSLESPQMRNFFLLTLLTAARKSNVLAMRWDDISFDLATWSIPANEFKNGAPHVVPLTEDAMAILARRRGSGTRSPWVFPGDGETGHIVEPKRAWSRVIERAGLQDVHIHDLRRTLASYMAIKGQSPYVIARMLGHRDMR